MSAERLGPYTLVLPDGCFPLGEDSLALGDFAPVKPGARVCDLGCGGGTLLLLLARREPSLVLTGVELDELSARAAGDNLARNRLAGEIVIGDLREKGLLLSDSGHTQGYSHPSRATVLLFFPSPPCKPFHSVSSS